MTPTPFHPDTLIDLADELRRAGYDIGIEQQIAAQDLVLALTAAGHWPEDAEEWQALLAPIFCSSPIEQEEFGRRFERFLKRNPKSKRQPHHDSRRGQEREIEQRKWNRFRRFGKPLAFIGILFLLLAIVAAYLLSSRTLTLQGTITSGENGPGLAGAKVYFDSLPQHVQTDEKGKYSIPYRVRKLDLLRGKVAKYFRVAHEEHFSQQIDIETHPAPPLNLALKKRNKGVSRPIDAKDPLPNATPAPIVSTPVVIEPREEAPFVISNRWRIGLSSIPLLIFILWLGRRWWRRRMLLEKLQSAGRPNLDRIVVRAPAERLFQGPGIRRAVQLLRLHKQAPATELNVPGTVREMIRRAGIFSPVYGMRKSLPEYLLLIERTNAHDELARLGDEIHHRLKSGEVFVERYYFQYDPRTCRRAEKNAPLVTLSDLAALYPEHRLLIFSDGAGWISPLTGEPEPWIEYFSPWEHRALLTPEPPEHWGEREDVFADHGFWIMPATEAGLLALGEAVNTGLSASPKIEDRSIPLPERISDQPKVWIDRQEPPSGEVQRLCSDLRSYLGEQDWMWFCAATVYPAVLWEITLYLGFKLPIGQTNIEMRLMRLVRLPWFRYGTMPDWLRMQLIGSLTRKQERQIRQAIREMLLTAVDQPQEGLELEIARQEPKEKPGLYNWLKRRRQKNRVNAFLSDIPEDSPLQDYVFLGFLAGRKMSQLNVGLPSMLRRILYPRGETRFGPRPIVGLLLTIALSTGIWFWIGASKPPEFAMNLPLRPFTYETVTLNETGEEISRRRLQGREFIEDLGNGVRIEMVPVQGGQFLMGLTSEEVQEGYNEAKRYSTSIGNEWLTIETPKHSVNISSLLIGKFEVTQQQWRAVAALPKVNLDLKSDPSQFKGDQLPVETVSWNEVKEFIARLNKHLGLSETNGYRLPSEAEWEYAARADSTGPFAFGPTINSYIINYNGNYPYGQGRKGPYDGQTIPVGSLGVANAWGLYDMHGNVWEWCEDHYHENYQGAPDDGRAWVNANDTGSFRVYRGGGWYGIAVGCRSANREYGQPGLRDDGLGFRLVRNGP